MRRLLRVLAFAVLFSITVGVAWPERADRIDGVATGSSLQASQAEAPPPLPAPGPPAVPCRAGCTPDLPLPLPGLPRGLPALG